MLTVAERAQRAANRKNVISTEGNAKALHFSPGLAGPDFFTPPGPDFNRANFHFIVQMRAGPRACFRLLLIFIF